MIYDISYMGSRFLISEPYTHGPQMSGLGNVKFLFWLLAVGAVYLWMIDCWYVAVVSCTFGFAISGCFISLGDFGLVLSGHVVSGRYNFRILDP